MPLRDHFRPPVWKLTSWEGFHGMWPASMVQQLNQVLPEGFSAEPRAHVGDYYEIDVSAFEGNGDSPRRSSAGKSSGGAATATYSRPKPTFEADGDITDEYEYEVLVFDQARGRQLVAAVEIVSPANKVRPKSRSAFVSKCGALLQKRVCVARRPCHNPQFQLVRRFAGSRWLC
jgi:hypothetical protein